MGIVDDLLAHPGLYVGIDTVTGVDDPAAARIVVTPLPGAAGVSLDYEVLTPANPENVRAHAEHTVMARSHGLGTIMLIGHPHGATTERFLQETSPGTFEPGDWGSSFPLKVVVEMPEPGTLRHSWWYGAPGTDAIERDVTVAELVR